MLTNPFTTAIQKVIVYAALAAVVALGGLAAMLWWRLGSVEADLDACAAARAELTGKLELQSKQIENWRVNADAAYEAGQEAVKQAEAAVKAAASRADALQARILAGGNGKTCVDALREIEGAWK